MIRLSLKHPISVIVIFIGLILFSIVGLKKIPIDIFPRLNLPTLWVIEQYGGMSPKDMEGFFNTRFQTQFLYVNGVKNIEAKNIQGLSLIKITFFEGTDMAEATGQLAMQIQRSIAFFPPGALPPQVVRFDASELPVGEVVFSSKTRSLSEISDIAYTKVRGMLRQVKGLGAPPPFGANIRTIVFNLSPERLREFNLSPDEVVEALVRNNFIAPSGNLRVGETQYITETNSLEQKVESFNDIPIRIAKDGIGIIYMKDIARVEDGSDIAVSYALINGKRSVYIPITKGADASTIDVVNQLKAKLPEVRSVIPDDIEVSYEFDQSVFVMNAVKSLTTEGILGAVLTGLMVLLFLRDLRSSFIVIITIPVSVLVAVGLLQGAGQTINIMTLSGLALAIGILVDQATVTIENIHQHLEQGKRKKKAVLDACNQISFAIFLILICILAVFAPALIMNGVPKGMFMPLSMSIGFAMIVSYLAAQSLVPVLSVWILKASKFQHHIGKASSYNSHPDFEMEEGSGLKGFERFKFFLVQTIRRWIPRRKKFVVIYLVLMIGLSGICFVTIGKDLLPNSNAGVMQLRIAMPDGTRLEVTEKITHKVLDIITQNVDSNVQITSAYVGTVPANFASSNLYIFSSGSHEATIQVALKEGYKVNMEDLKERLRAAFKKEIPELSVVFEPIELTQKIMAEGASTPIEVRVAAGNMQEMTEYGEKLVKRLQEIPFLRDVRIAQPLYMPYLKIDIDRTKLALLNLDIQQVSKSITDATSSSRYTDKNLWLDNSNSYTYQTQVFLPEYLMNSIEALESIPLLKGQSRPILKDVATIRKMKEPGEYDRSGPRRYITVNANIHKKDLGGAAQAVRKVISEMKNTPKGLVAEVLGMASLLTETLGTLQVGLIAAIIVILLIQAANFQSFSLSVCVLATVPAVLFGSLALLLLTGSTLNLQSYMGIIMSVGVSVSNAILIVTNAESLRIQYKDPFKAAMVAVKLRLRPILMTSLAMIAGMIPMASGLSESGDQTAPLGRAVIGGLFASTFAALFIIPLVYAWMMQNKHFNPPSLLPEDDSEESKYLSEHS